MLVERARSACPTVTCACAATWQAARNAQAVRPGQSVRDVGSAWHQGAVGSPLRTPRQLTRAPLPPRAAGFRWAGTSCKACASEHCDICPEETDEVVNCAGCKPGYQLEIDETCTPCVSPPPATTVAGTCVVYAPAGGMECACQQCNTWMPQWCDVPEQTFFAA